MALRDTHVRLLVSWVALILLGGFSMAARAQQASGPLVSAELPDAPSSFLLQAADAPLTASISGIVLNINDDPVGDATITLVDHGHPGERIVTSGADGVFTFGSLAPGKYTVTIHAPGLETFVSPEIPLRPNERHQLQRIALPIAATSTDVQVTVTQVEIAQEQIKLQEQQRVFGVLPNFYTSYVWDAAPLTAKQKFDLALHSILDPVDFVITGGVAGVEQASDAFHDYHQGVRGYAKRYGASYADGAIARVLGSAVFPSILRQDPRYFYKGSGSKKSRAWHAISSAVITRQDGGSLRPNYSHIAGSFVGGAISNAYHPAANRGVSLTLRNGLIDTAGNAANNLLREFVLRNLTPKVPTYATGKP